MPKYSGQTGEGEPDPDGEVLFEFRQAGPQVRVSAIDAASGLEVVIIAPKSATRHQMQLAALAKLRRQMSSRI